VLVDFRTPRGMPDALEYQRREPENTVLYRVVQQNLETFLASATAAATAPPTSSSTRSIWWLAWRLSCPHRAPTW
jgi:hypothetical protein